MSLCLEGVEKGLDGQLRLAQLARQRLKLRHELLRLTERALIGAADSEYQVQGEDLELELASEELVGGAQAAEHARQLQRQHHQGV